MNSVQHQGRYYKEDVLKKEMRKLLSENPNGIDGGEFVEKIGKVVGVSRGMIFAHIKDFESSDLMRIERSKPDRRKVVYFPNVEKVETEQSFSGSMEFIRNLGPHVNFAEDKAENKEFRARCSVFTNDEKLPKEELQGTAKNMADSLLKILSMKIKMEKLKIKPSFRNAYVLTLEKK